MWKTLQYVNSEVEVWAEKAEYCPTWVFLLWSICWLLPPDKINSNVFSSTWVKVWIERNERMQKQTVVYLDVLVTSVTCGLDMGPTHNYSECEMADGPLIWRRGSSCPEVTGGMETLWPVNQTQLHGEREKNREKSQTQRNTFNWLIDPRLPIKRVNY